MQLAFSTVFECSLCLLLLSKRNTLFARLDKPAFVRRQYIQDFNITPLESTRLKCKNFSRVRGKFQEDYQAPHATSNRKGTGITQDINAKNFQRNPTHSISKAAANFGYSKRTTWRIAKELKLKPFKIIKTQKTSPVNYQMRHTFCLWFINMLNLTTNFASNVIFYDEKWWVLDSAPNSQNQRHWSLVNPREILECKYQGKKKGVLGGGA